MAKYNRDFLVQYFKDIYALYALRRKINQEISQNQNQIDYLNKGVLNNPYPSSPIFYALGAKYYCYLLLIIPSVLGALLLGVRLLEVGWSEAPGLGTLFIIFLLVIFVSILLMVKEKRSINEANEDLQAEYEKELATYHSTAKKNEEYRKSIPNHIDKIVSYETERDRVDKLINKLYSVNIIPTRYRDFYCIVYLYDYFSGSRENDLGMALNTYVLEQIKDRLDRLIVQMSHVILNQYMIMDNQQAAIEQAEKHHAEMMRKLKRLQATADEHSVYLDMINANTATMKYFAMSDYVKKL